MLQLFDIISEMSSERIFPKTVSLMGGNVIIHDGVSDRIIKNPVAEKKIKPELLNNLTSLSILVEGSFEDSSSQNYYNLSIEELKTKYPNEQPEEVWRRSLSTLARDGIGIRQIALSLLESNPKYQIGRNLGNISPQEREMKLQKLQQKISEYWPKPRTK